MTTYRTPAEPGKLQPYAPLDPQALHGLAQHADDVLMPAAIGPERKPLGEAAGQLAIALSEFARLVEADADDQLACGEDVVERLRRASMHVHEHMAAKVPAAELEARNTGLIESCLEEGLPVVGSVTAELLLAGGRAATVRLTKETAHQEVEVDDGRTTLLPAADHLIVRDGLHDLARLLAPLTRETSTSTGRGQ
ncbi:hypothetical protein [Streptomyces malaysiensis]|uniref:hypothetical protein n=1 Tax=Streptomyces malaysiensis TaxID=92644 RepID=UPI0011CDA35A|nr:hypothetical protein [Streptomyces malaysiensis]